MNRFGRGPLRRFFFVSTVLLAAVFVSVIGGTKLQADGIIKSFKPKGTLQPGLLVSLVDNTKDTVEALPASSPQKVYGVVVDPSDVPITIQKSSDQIYVASSGSFSVLVSTENGSIKSGDYLSGSTIDGVAAKATINQAVVIGRALQDFKGGSSTIFSTGSGASVGLIPAQIAPGNNPNSKSDIGVPSTLRKIGNSIAGKNVTALRIYAAVLILMLGIVVAAILLLGGIRTGISAIGRNPLSKKSIFRSIIQVMVVVVLVFVASLMGIYILLKI